MNLSEASKIRFNGADIKMAKLNGDVVYIKEKEEVDPLLIAQYTASESGAIPKFNTDFTGYNVSETIVDGTYSVTIRTNTVDNTPTSIIFDSMRTLLTVGYLRMNNVTDMSYMFRNCSSLTSLDVSDWNTSKVTTMANMFRSCNTLTSLDLSGLDTSNVTNMSNSFYSCSRLTSLDLSGFDTSKVTTMSNMFRNCGALTSLNLSGWDTSNVTNMEYMFYGCRYLTSLDLSGWDTSQVTNMTNMFNGCEALTSLDSMINISTNLTLPSSLNKESVLDVIDNLASVSSKKITMSRTQSSWIPDYKIIEINNKGWTISA